MTSDTILLSSSTLSSIPLSTSNVGKARSSICVKPLCLCLFGNWRCGLGQAQVKPHRKPSLLHCISKEASGSGIPYASPVQVDTNFVLPLTKYIIAAKRSPLDLFLLRMEVLYNTITLPVAFFTHSQASNDHEKPRSPRLPTDRRLLCHAP